MTNVRDSLTWFENNWEKTMAKKMTLAAKIRRMLDKGYEPFEVARRLKCDVQRVHTVRYLDRKKAAPLGPGWKPLLREATPKKRGRPRKALLKEDSSSPEKAVIQITPAQHVHAAHASIIYVKPTLAQRVKGWFTSWQ